MEDLLGLVGGDAEGRLMPGGGGFAPNWDVRRTAGTLTHEGRCDRLAGAFVGGTERYSLCEARR